MKKNPEVLTPSETNIIYGFTNNLPLRLGLNLCIILAKYYIYNASRREEEYIWEAFFAFMKNHLDMEKHKCKLKLYFELFLCNFIFVVVCYMSFLAHFSSFSLYYVVIDLKIFLELILIPS